MIQVIGILNSWLKLNYSSISSKDILIWRSYWFLNAVIINHIINVDLVKLATTKLKVDWEMRILIRKSRGRKDFTSRLAHGRRGWKKWSTGIKLVLRVLNLSRNSNISGNCYFLGWKRNGKGKDGFMSLPVDSILSTFCTFMFPILNTIRLSDHEQVSSNNTEQTSINICTYFLSFFKTTTIPTQLLRSF